MNLHQIRAFVAVYEEGAFARAALRAHATQSGLSTQVRNLEDRLGVTLFERSARGVAPTTAGRRYYARVMPILGSLEAAEQEVRDIAGALRGELHVGLMPSQTRHCLGRVLADFTALYPNVDVHIVEAFSATLTDQTLAGELDFAVVPPLTAPVGLETRLLARDHEVLFSGPALGLPAMQPVRLADVAPLKLCVPARQNSRRGMLEQYIATEGIGVERMMEVDSLIATIDLVRQSDWTSVMPLTACIDEVRAGGDGINPIVEPTIPFAFVLVWPTRRPLSTAAQRLVEMLADELAGATAPWRDIIGAAVSARRPAA